jgi:hypothetical protein
MKKQDKLVEKRAVENLPIRVKQNLAGGEKYNQILLLFL